jgi:hypothetical protein
MSNGSFVEKFRRKKQQRNLMREKKKELQH